MSDLLPATVEESKSLVCAALVKAQGELEAAHFDSSNPYFKSKYASLGAVIEVSRPVLAKHGLAIQQTPKTIRDGFIGVQTTIVHTSGQTLDGGWLELPVGDDKGTSLAQKVGSLITYLRRYSWSSVLGIYADEDNDGHEPAKPPQKAPQRTANAPRSDSEDKKVSGQPAQPQNDSEAIKWSKIRLKLLNHLEAAPGQPMHQLLWDYLWSKKWITKADSVGDWPSKHIPITEPQVKAFMEDWQRFEQEQRQQQELQEEMI
jgi:hypothetical protein